MGFHTLVYHEVRENLVEFGLRGSQLVAQDYYDIQLPSALFVQLEAFKEQMQYLVDNHYHFLTLSEVKKYYNDDYVLPDKSVLLTFDDAFQSVYYLVYPILKELKINAVMFVVSGWLFEQAAPFNQQKSQVMSVDQLATITDVFELANHTHSLHTRLADGVNGVMEATPTELSKDLTMCNQYVEHTDIFAYPFGFYNEKVLKQLENNGIQFAFTTQPGVNERQTPPLKLNRLLVNSQHSLNDFITNINI